MKNKGLLAIAALLVVVLLVSTIMELRATTRAVASDKEEIKIGWIGALTGDTAIVGQENLRGVEIAVDQINEQNEIDGKKIKLIVQDDGYDEKQTINAYREMNDFHDIDYFLLVTYGGYLALAENAEKDGTILVNSIDSSEEFSNIGENAFSVGVYDESIGYAIADYLNAQGIETVGLLTNIDDAFPLLASDAFKRRFNGKIVEENYGFNINDFRSILTKLSNENHIVFVGWEETGRIVKQAKELGLDSQIYGIDTFASEDFKANTDGNYEGLKFSFWEGSQSNPKFNELVFDYKKKYGKLPDNELFLVAGYDSASVLLNAFQECDSKDTECVKRGLENTKGFKGAAGTITMDSDHITRSIKERMFMYQNKKIVALDN